MEQLSDNALMLEVKNGDLEKLSLLFERYKKRLFGFFFNLTYDRPTSEDLVQNTFVRILKYRSSYRGEHEFKVWMFQVGRNVANDHFRKNRIHTQTVEIDSRSHSLASEDLNQEEYFTRSEEMLLLKKALLRLPAEKREVLTLSKIEGMKYREIGAVLGCPEGTVKARVFRALEALKGEYEWLQSNV